MAISVSIKKFKGKEYVYITDGFRDPVTKKPTSRVLESFGNKEKLLASDPNAMEKVKARAEELRKNSKAYSNALEQKLGAGVSVGSSAQARTGCYTCTPAPYLLFWERLGMKEYFRNYTRNNGLQYDLGKTVFYSCVSRIVRPSSKRFSWKERNRFLIDFDDIRLEDMYGCLDVLANRKDAIIKRLNDSIGRLYKRSLTIALYDVTTFYFESFTEDALRSRGMSKEHRTQETQVVLGLLVDADGVPFNYELFPGNTAELHTLIQVVSKFKKDYGLKDVTVIADSGLNQLANLDRLTELGFNYIVGYPPYVKLKRSEQKALLSEEDWSWHLDQEGKTWGFKKMDLPIDKNIRDPKNGGIKKVHLDSVCIATFSEHRENHDIKELELKWERAKALVGKGAGAVKASSRSGYKSFVKINADTVSVNQELYEKRKQWCGYMALLTNIKDAEPMRIYRLLRQLWRIEDNFRVLKTNLEARPVFVWTEPHIRGHFLLNYIALVMQKTMMKELTEKGLPLSAAEIVRAFESMKVSPLNGLKKASSHLYGCSNEIGDAVSVSETDESPKTLQNLCDELLLALGLEPLNGIETSASIQKKLKISLPIH